MDTGIEMRMRMLYSHGAFEVDRSCWALRFPVFAKHPKDCHRAALVNALPKEGRQAQSVCADVDVCVLSRACLQPPRHAEQQKE